MRDWKERRVAYIWDGKAERGREKKIAEVDAQTDSGTLLKRHYWEDYV